MAKGVNKIIMYKGLYYTNKSNSLTSQVTIKPDKTVSFRVHDWLDGTTKEEKAQEVYWMRQTNDRKTILFKVKSSGYSLTIPKKQCGPYAYYVEASMSGNRDFKNQAGIYVNGYSEKLIKSSQWRAKPEGANIKNGKPIKYGSLVYLYLNTEGLNGDSITIEIYNQAFGADDFIHRYTNVRVKNGEVLLKIGNTSAWMAKINHIEGVEEFYIKAKKGNTYIKDHLGDDKHAVYLNVKKELISNEEKPSENLTPTKIFKPQVNAERFEPCKFDEIIITAPKEQNGKMITKSETVFKNGQKLTKAKATTEHINRTAHFTFNDSSIAPDAQKILNNILGFLLGHKGTRMTMSGYACVIGSKDYNTKLSQLRSDAVKNFFVSGGLDADRIISKGRGEYNIQSADDYNKRNEKVYKDARRVDISFTFAGHDANSIIFEMIAPSNDKMITLDAIGLDTKDCYRDSDKHKTEIIIKSLDNKEHKGSGTSLRFPVRSTLSTLNLAPLNYIWPKYNALIRDDSAAIYLAHIHSCRYYSDKTNPTLKIIAYPDIRWTLKFFLNLTNDLSVKWMNMDPKEHKDLQKKSGKIGAENRWKQKDASFGFSLKGEWDKPANNYTESDEFKYEYETKFKKLYDVFSSVGAMADGITNKTKGKARSISPKGIPVSFEVKPPNLDLTGIWNLEKVKNDQKDEKIGTTIDISLNANPLIGLEITIDLLGALIFGAAAITGASVGVTRLYQQIQGKLKSGIDVGDDERGFKANVDIYMDLIISNTINTSIGFNFNTAGKTESGSEFKIEAENRLKVELKVGVKLKGELVIAVMKAEAYFEASASAEASITFGHGVKYDKTGLFYQPKLGFDGLNAEYIVYISVGLALKIAKDKNKINTERDKKWIIAEGEYKNVISPFDVIEELEELFDMSSKIPLITNKED
ncbi:MAG: OmpA family protein [Aequorivita sp.]